MSLQTQYKDSIWIRYWRFSQNLISKSTTHIKCNKRFAVVGICGEHSTAGATLTFHKWNWGSVQLDIIPRVLVILSSGTYMWRWPLHLHGPWDIVPSFHWCPSWPAWLPLKCIWWSLLWCTLRPCFGLWGLCIGHVIWVQWVVIGQLFCIIWPRKSERNSWRIWSGHSRVALRAALRCSKGKVLKMATAGSWTHHVLSQSWWGWWDIAVVVWLWVWLMIWCRLSGKSRVWLICLCVIRVAVSALHISFWFTKIHLHNLNVLFHASINFLHLHTTKYWCNENLSLFHKNKTSQCKRKQGECFGNILNSTALMSFWQVQLSENNRNMQENQTS